MKRLMKRRRIVVAALALCVFPVVMASAQAQQQAPEQTWQEFMQWQQPPMNDQERRDLRSQAEFFARSLQEPNAQSAVVSYTLANLEAVRPLSLQAYKLRGALLCDRPEEEVGVMLDDLRAALLKEKQRRAEALQQLDAQIGFSKKPQLEKFLLLTGALGEERAVINTFPDALRRTKSDLQAPGDSLSQALSSLDVTDAKTRESITRYAQDYEKAVVPLVDQAETINLVAFNSVWIEHLGLNVPANDDGLRELLKRFRESVTAFKVQRAEKLRALDEQIGYSVNPRLDAALVLLGTTDDNANLLNAHDEGAVVLGYARFNDPITGEQRKPQTVQRAFVEKLLTDARVLSVQTKAEIERRGAEQPK